jgi:5'-3' exonuclease
MKHYLFCYVQVKLGEPGWRERYYEDKFGARTPEQIEEIRRDVVSFSSVAQGNIFLLH